MTTTAINGFGRIGRSFLRAALQRNSAIDIVAVNDLADPALLAHLFRYDSAAGTYDGTVDVDGDTLIIDDHRIRVLSERDPANLPWNELDIDVVLESTGRFTSSADAGKHLAAGSKKVIISAPASDEGVPTFVLGVNEATYDARIHHVVSNGSCTTNSLATIAKVLIDSFGIERGFMTTIHAYTADQNLQDGPHKDFRRARAAGVNIIPTSTGAAKAIGVVIPELHGKLDGYALRVPVIAGSLTDLTVETRGKVSVAEINNAFHAAAMGPMQGILAYTEEPLVSTDILGNPHSSILDAGLTKVIGTQVKVAAWYDNEWAFSNRLVELTELVGSAARSRQRGGISQTSK